MGDHIRQCLQLIHQLGLDARNPDVAQLKALLEQGRITDGMAKVYLDWLLQMTEGIDACRLLLPRPPRLEEWEALGKPDLELGNLIETPGARFGITLRGAQHSAMIGQSGSGKTISLRVLIKSVEEWNARNPNERVAIVAITFKPGDFADLPRLYGSRWRHFSTHNNMRLGLNGPRELPPEAWIQQISMCFAARAGLKASEISLARMIRTLLAAMNPKPAQDLLWPSFSLIREVAQQVPLSLFAAKPEYEKSLLQKLDAIADDPLFDTFNGLDLQRDIVDRGHSVVIDTSRLDGWIRRFVADGWILQLLLGREFSYRKTNRLNTIVVFDEADALVSKEAEGAFEGSMTPNSKLQAEGREFGLAGFFGLKKLGGLAPHLAASFRNIFVLQSGDAASLGEAQRTLLLPPGSETVLPILKDGECLARTSNGWPYAVLCQFDSVPPSRVERSEVQFDSPAFMPSQPLSALPHVQKALDELVKAHKDVQMRQARSSRPKLTDNTHKLLSLASAQLFVPVARLFDQIGQLSPTAQATVRKSLEEASLAAFEEIRIGRRNSLLIEVTDKGWELLGGTPPKRTGRGGIAHRHIAAWLCMLGRKHGHQAQTEWIVPGGANHPVDAVWITKTAVLAFEVVCKCEANLGDHLKKCLRPRAVESVTIVAPQKATLDALRETVARGADLNSLLEWVRWEPVEPMLKELWP